MENYYHQIIMAFKGTPLKPSCSLRYQNDIELVGFALLGMMQILWILGIIAARLVSQFLFFLGVNIGSHTLCHYGSLQIFSDKETGKYIPYILIL